MGEPAARMGRTGRPRGGAAWTEWPSGSVTFLFTDIEGSTGLWERHPVAMGAALVRHDALLGGAIAEHGGVVFKTVGDAFCAAFASAPSATAAAVAAQRAFLAEPWAETGPVRVRMALHRCEAEPRPEGDYRTPGLNRLGRLMGAGAGCQVILSAAAAEAARSGLAAGVGLRDLGEHRLRDLLRAEPIYQLLAPDLPADFPPLKTLERHRHNLPAQPTALVGRERDVAEALALLGRADGRLLTLTGPGGTGKTRLAVQVAAEAVETFVDGVWFVPLAAVTDPEGIVPAIARTLGVREGGEAPLEEALVAYLGPRQALVVLDNVEQVVAGAPAVAALLAACPRLAVLATSRTALRVFGERLVPVPPLALPVAGRLPPLAELAQVEAIRLFSERAGAVAPGFGVTEANGPAIAEICRRLDGLPLAIELAAARVRLLPPAALLSRLERRLPLLTGGGRDRPARQQTLRGAIGWSHDLLDADDRRLFARLSVFAGGWTAEAAEAVCGEEDGPALDVLDGLERLVDQSLLRAEEEQDGTARLAMLETIREFAQERLEEGEEAASTRGRHGEFFLGLAEEAEPRLTGPAQGEWLDRLETEHDNLRAALAWAAGAGAADLGLRLAGSLWRFWWVRGHLSEGRRWLEQALRQRDDASSAVRAKALDGVGVLMATQGDHGLAKEHHEAALGLWRASGDRIGEFRALTNLGIVADEEGDSTRAAALYEGALAMARELGDRAGIASSLGNLGGLAILHGDRDRASASLEESLGLFRELGDRSGLSGALSNLGILAFSEGDYVRSAALYAETLELAKELGNRQIEAIALANLGHAVQQQGDVERAGDLYQQALDLFRDLGDRGGVAFALTHLGRVAHHRGDDAEAERLFVESLVLGRQIGEKEAIAEALEGLAGVATDHGNAERGAQLTGAAEALREAISVPLPEVYRVDQERRLAAVRAALGESGLAAARAAGRARTEDVVAELVDGAAPDNGLQGG